MHHFFFSHLEQHDKYKKLLYIKQILSLLNFCHFSSLTHVWFYRVCNIFWDVIMCVVWAIISLYHRLFCPRFTVLSSGALATGIWSLPGHAKAAHDLEDIVADHVDAESASSLSDNHFMKTSLFNPSRLLSWPCREVLIKWLLYRCMQPMRQ